MESNKNMNGNPFDATPCRDPRQKSIEINANISVR